MILEFTKYLVNQLVTKPIEIEVIEESDQHLFLEVKVDRSELSRVIGKDGAVANAIRTLVQTASYNRGKKKVKINFEER